MQRAPDGPGRGEVGRDPVADHDRLGRLATDGVRRGLEQVRRGLADRDRDDAGRGLEGDDERAGARSQPALRRVDRVAVGGDEMGAGPDAVRGDHQPRIGQVRVEPDDDRVRVAGGREAVDRLLAHPGRGRARRDHVVADVAQLALEPAPAEDQHAPDLGVVLAQVRRRRPGGRHDRVGRDRRAHRREAGLVVGPVVHRVVGHVDDVVATDRAIGKDRGDARDRVGAAVDDAVEIDEQEEAHGPIVAARPAPRTMAPMPQQARSKRDRDPLAATRRLLVDGTNLLHAMATSSAGAAPPAALIGRLRGAIPAATTIELVFDGPPERGLRNERIASGLIVRYGGPRTADAVILAMIDDVRLVDGADGTAGLLVVTDDRDLRHGARLRGARTAGSAWLLGRLDARKLSSPSVGNPRAARVPRGPSVGEPGGPPRRARRRPPGLAAGTRRDDQAGQPATGAQGQWDW